MAPIFSDEVEVKLRDRLTPSEIAKIKYPDHPETAAERDDDVRKKALGDKRERLTAILEKACLAGYLKYEGEPVHWVNEIIPNSLPKYPPPGSHIEPQTYKKLIPSTIKIHFSEFAKFVENDKKWFEVNFWQELANWWSDDGLEIEIIDDPNQGKRDKQVEFICKIANSLEYSDLLSLSIEDKATIKTKCLENIKLFTDSGFDHAWKEANDRKLISIQNKEKFRPR